MKIENNVFIVTGGASGLGAATAEILLNAGAKVSILDVVEPGFDASDESNNLFIRTDVRNEGDVLEAIKLTKEKFGQLNGAINCAGIGPAERVAGKHGPHRLELFKKTIEINLIGSFNVVRLVAHELQSNDPDENRERGVLINTASIAAYDGQIGQAAYSASKGGIVSMTLPIARELARFGIRVMTIAPGIFETPLLAGLPDEVKESLGAQVPFPSRLGRPQEFANLVKHIIENPMLNGEVIRLDGALRMAPK